MQGKVSAVMLKIYSISGFLMLAASNIVLGDESAVTGNSAPATAWRMSEGQKDRYLRAMQEHSLEMHDLSNRILAEQDPVKRQALKDQQLQLMKDYRARMIGRLEKLRDKRAGKMTQ